MNMHHPSSGGDKDECGVINSRVLQQTVAAKWAVDVINNRSLSSELRIGQSYKDILLKNSFCLKKYLTEIALNDAANLTFENESKRRKKRYVVLVRTVQETEKWPFGSDFYFLSSSLCFLNSIFGVSASRNGVRQVMHPFVWPYVLF